MSHKTHQYKAGSYFAKSFELQSIYESTARSLRHGMDKQFKTYLAGQLRTFRRNAGLTQAELATRINRTGEAISNIERGKSQPTLETLIAIAETLAVSVFMISSRAVGLTTAISLNRLKTEAEAMALLRGLTDGQLTVALAQIKALRELQNCAPWLLFQLAPTRQSWRLAFKQSIRHQNWTECYNMTSASHNAPGSRSWTLLFFLSFVWGGAFMSMSLALEQYGPLTVAAGRIGIGALALLAVVAITRPGDLVIRDRKILGLMLLLGILNFALPFSLLAWALQQVPSGFAGVAMGSSPIFVLLMAYFFVPDEQIGPRRIAGVILGFVGLLVLILPGTSADLGAGETVAAKIACVAAALCYSVGGILIRRAPPISPMVFTAGMLTAGALVLTPLALLVEGLPEITGTRATWAMLYVGIVPTGLAFLLRVVLIQSAGPIFMSLVAYIVPLWAVLLGVFFSGRNSGAQHLHRSGDHPVRRWPDAAAVPLAAISGDLGHNPSRFILCPMSAPVRQNCAFD